MYLKKCKLEHFLFVIINFGLRQVWLNHFIFKQGMWFQSVPLLMSRSVDNILKWLLLKLHLFTLISFGDINQEIGKMGL